MTFRRITAAEIGRRVGTSEETVRKVLGNFPGVDPATKAAVLRALARALHRKIATLCIDRVAA